MSDRKDGGPAFPDTPHNAGQTIKVENIIHGPVSPFDFGDITVTENWGRLFIRWDDGDEIVLVRPAYRAFRDAISHFIAPAKPDADRITTLEDHARVLAEALRPFGFFDEDGGDAQWAWEIRYRDSFQDWVDFADIERARAALDQHQKIMEGK